MRRATRRLLALLSALSTRPGAAKQAALTRSRQQGVAHPRFLWGAFMSAR